MLEVIGLSRDFAGCAALESASFAVAPGEVVGLVGPNGAGKSVLLRLVAGALAPSRGTAHVCGHDIQKRPLAARRRLGYLPQTVPAYPEMTAAAFLGFCARLRGLDTAAATARIAGLAERLDIAASLARPIAMLPADRRRLVGLVQAVLHDPPVLLLDNPSEGLDPNRQQVVDEMLQEIVAEKAIIVATHRLDEVERLCGRVIVIAAGRIRADSPLAELARRARRHNSVRLALSPGADAAAITAELTLLPFVRAVEPANDRDGPACRVLSWHGRPIVAEIAEVARARGWPLAALSAERGRLDDIYRAMTMADAAETL
jgi:ABC-2 type transport system ATP-binding protein